MFWQEKDEELEESGTKRAREDGPESSQEFRDKRKADEEAEGETKAFQPSNLTILGRSLKSC